LLSMKYFDAPEDTRASNITHIEERWEQLSGQLQNVITEGMKYLFLTNAGGSVAMLTFISTAKGHQQVLLEQPRF
jgi:hypothetical protein